MDIDDYQTLAIYVFCYTSSYATMDLEDGCSSSSSWRWI